MFGNIQTIHGKLESANLRMIIDETEHQHLRDLTLKVSCGPFPGASQIEELGQLLWEIFARESGLISVDVPDLHLVEQRLLLLLFRSLGQGVGLEIERLSAEMQEGGISSHGRIGRNPEHAWDPSLIAAMNGRGLDVEDLHHLSLVDFTLTGPHGALKALRFPPFIRYFLESEEYRELFEGIPYPSMHFQVKNSHAYINGRDIQ